jgi:GTPase SAR1 family protein
MLSGHVFLLVYSATSLESFHALGEFYDQVRSCTRTHRTRMPHTPLCASLSRDQINQVKDSLLTPMVLVENKTDLVEERQVPEGVGEMAARALGCLFASCVPPPRVHSTPSSTPAHSRVQQTR